MANSKEPLVYSLESDFDVKPKGLFLPLQTEISWATYPHHHILSKMLPKLIYNHNPEIQFVPILSFLSETVGERFSIFVKKIECIYHRNGYDYTLQSPIPANFNTFVLSFGSCRKIEVICPKQKKRTEYDLEDGDVFYIPKTNNAFFSIPRSKAREPQISLIFYFCSWGERKLCIPKIINVNEIVLTLWVKKNEKIKSARHAFTEPEIFLNHLFIDDEEDVQSSTSLAEL